MSLINEALKRANQAQSQQETEASRQFPSQTASEPRMRPVEAKASSTAPVIYILTTALIVVLLGAMLLLWMWSKSNQQTVAQNNESVLVHNTEMKPVTATVASSEAVPAHPNAIPVKAVLSTNAPIVAQPPAIEVKAEGLQPLVTAPTPAESVAVPETAPIVPSFPTLKLQGIFYNRVNPAAVINGKTYSVGGAISGARITKIEPDKVIVEWNGETRILETSQ
jgi:type II secretory pathway component PulC